MKLQEIKAFIQEYNFDHIFFWWSLEGDGVKIQIAKNSTFALLQVLRWWALWVGFRKIGGSVLFPAGFFSLSFLFCFFIPNLRYFYIYLRNIIRKYEL